MEKINSLKNIQKQGVKYIFENKTTLLIPKSIGDSNEYSNYAITVYCLLQELSVPSQLPIQCITCDQLVFYLTGDVSQRRNKISDYIKCGLRELTDNRIVQKIEEFSKHYILDCNNLWIDSSQGNFTKIYFNEVQKIFCLKNVNQFSLLRYFILLIGTLSGKITVYLSNGEYKNCVVGNFTLEYLSQLSGIGERTIIEYNKLLEENKLIYIHRQNDFVFEENNGIRQLPNVYGRYCDYEYVDMFAKNQKQNKDSYNYRKNNHEKANTKRKFAQMYLQLLKGMGEKYSKEEILDIYKYVLEENKKYERMYAKEKDENYLDKIRDIEVFKNYEFLTEEITYEANG